MKKIICLLLAFSVMTVSVFCDDAPETYTAASVTTNAKSAVLIDADTGNVLYEENKDEKLPLASITKIMTMILVMESLDAGNVTYDTLITCSEHAKSMGGSEIWLEVGEQMTVRDLLKAVAVNSANDAAVLLAETVGGTEENFVAMMNEKAKSLGMTNTNFINACGLDADGHYSSAYDISLMSVELLKHKEIKEFTTIWTDTLRNGKTELTNTNKLIRFYKGATGLKTGYTSKAGYCLSASAERQGLSLIAVIMGCDSIASRLSGVKSLLEYGFASYAYYKPEIDKTFLHDIKVIKGKEEYVGIKMPAFDGFAVKRELKDKITYNVDLAHDLEAPVEEGQRVGTVSFSADGNVLKEYGLYAEKHIKKMSYGDGLMKLLLNLIFMG